MLSDQTHRPGTKLRIDLLRHGAHPPVLKQERHQTWAGSEFRRRWLDLLASGRSVASVAAELGISDQTIYWLAPAGAHRPRRSGRADQPREG
ncbi:helix-turn-helix domain-containing protein [Serinicoccus marinus]|uniref:helix-turn-helix domain-containing protein n=1 Tax=Serinicoccus marinus TaxID=247333 RepID=UPI001375D7B3